MSTATATPCRPTALGLAGKHSASRPAGAATIAVQRVNIAERLYRLTGAGIYSDSVLLGDKVPLAHPLLNAGVVGQDSIQTVEYRGQMYWFWGDTSRLDYPLGVFDMTGATTPLAASGTLQPTKGIDFDYFKDDAGKSRGACQNAG